MAHLGLRTNDGLANDRMWLNVRNTLGIFDISVFELHASLDHGNEILFQSTTDIHDDIIRLLEGQRYRVSDLNAESSV